MQKGQVVKLDRGYPLVRTDGGRLVRCEHATALVKGEQVRAVIGDWVEVAVPEGHDKGIIEAILPRTRAFVRKDPTERALPQVLAANFDRVFVAQPLSDMNFKRLERELVLAYETGAAVTVVLTKADLAESEDAVRAVRDRVRELAGPAAETVVVSAADPASVEAVRVLVPAGTTAVFIGKSGVGKSSLVNLLVGHEMQETAEVREGELAELSAKAQASGSTEDAEAVQKLAAACNRFEKKLSDLDLSRTVAMQMAPQIRLVQNNEMLMIEKIQTTLVNTIPLWKSQMLLALGLANNEAALKAQSAVTDMTNELLRKNAEKLKASTVEVARESERGIVDIETLKATNENLIQTFDEVMKIQAEGRAKRAEAEVEMRRMEAELRQKLLEVK